ADRFAALIADHVTAVQNVGIRTIVPAEAVFVRPVFAAASNACLDPINDPLLLVRVDPVIARFDPRLDLLGPITEQGSEGFVPPNLVCLQSPVPQDVVACPPDQLKTL